MTKVTVQYRQLKADGMPQDATLKGMIIDAMRSRRGESIIGANAKSRIIDIDQDGSYVILNKITEPAAWDGQIFVGQLIHLQQGADVAAVMQSLEEDAEEFLLQLINLGEASVAKGILYFAAVGNHVGLIEGQQVKGRTLERYLTSLFQKVDLLEPGGAPVVLNSRFLAGDGKELAESTEITVQAERNLGASVAAAAEALDEIVEREHARLRREGATVFDVLRTLGWDEQAIAALDHEIPSDGWIEGFFKVFIKRKNRKAKISRATINEALRNIDPADIGMDGDGKERGGIVKLSVKKNVAALGTLLDPADAKEQIVNALKEWSEAGKIDCTFD